MVALRAHLADVADDLDSLVFASTVGTPLDPDNLRVRVLKPAAGEAGASWAGWHSLRHTFASLQLARGTNVLQLSRALGHHSPAFTLERYCHLLPGGEAEPLDLDDVRSRVNGRVNAPHGSQTHGLDAELPKMTA